MFGCPRNRQLPEDTDPAQADLFFSRAGELAARYGVRFLPSEFRKREGYKRSLTLSAEYGLYRQDYCGCVFSRKAREAAQ